MSSVSVIVPARDAAATLPALLDALAPQAAAAAAEVIVVDNGSRDATAQLAESAAAVSRTLRLPRGGGPGAARNAGAHAAGGELLAFLDADCLPAPGWLAAGVAAAGRADLVQGRVTPDPHAALGPFDRTLTVNGAHGLFETANLFVRRRVFETVGGFPAGLEDPAGRGPASAPFGEDVLFAWSAVRGGARTVFCPQALVHHAVFPRGAAELVAERRRARLFPELVRRVPELREAFLWRRRFLSRRSAAFDGAVAASAAALLLRRAAPLALTVPYCVLLLADARRWGRRAPAVALAAVAADAVTLQALAAGSLRSGTLLL